MAKPLRIGVLSTDPSVTNLGVCFQIITIGKATITSKVVATDTLKVVKHFKQFMKTDPEIKDLDDRLIKLILIGEYYDELIEEYKPDQLCSESAFSHRHAAAFEALTQVITTLKLKAAEKLVSNIEMHPPQHVKRLFTGKGTADKDAMREQLRIYNNDGTIALHKDLDDLTEHEVDAIAIGFTHGLARFQEKPS